VFFTITGNAQINNKTKINELTQDQLNLEMTKSLKKIKAAKVWTGVGAGLGITGGIIIYYGTKKYNSEGSSGGIVDFNEGFIAGVPILAFGVVTAGLAIPTWTKASKRKTDIELELIKFNPKGSASISDIGLKIRF
jgi:hypothetical protein